MYETRILKLFADEILYSFSDMINLQINSSNFRFQLFHQNEFSLRVKKSLNKKASEDLSFEKFEIEQGWRK